MTKTLKRALNLFHKGSYRQSDELYKEFLEDNPHDSGAWHMRGYIATQLNELEKAVEYISRAMELKPDSYTMHVNLGSALSALKQYDRAIASLQTAIDLTPIAPDAQFALGNCLRAKGEPNQADAAYLEAIRHKPDWAEALEAASLNAEKMGEHDKALDYALRALAQDATLLLSNKIAGNIYLRYREYDLAHKHYVAALESDPKDPTANSNLATLFYRMGNYEDSVRAFEKALALDPDSLVLQHGLSLSLLTLGRLTEGWVHYGVRIKLDGHLLGARPMLAPTILERPSNLRVLAWADEGVGDQVMFASLIPEIAADCASLSVECDARLAPLFQRSFPNIEVIPRQNPPHPKFHASYDGQFCLSNAARWYRPDFDSFPKALGYLSADAKLTRELRQSYQPKARQTLLIGVSWRTAVQAKVSVEKTIELGKWGPLLSVPGVTFVNLQYGDCRAEISEVEKSHGVQIISDPRIDPLKDLDSFASQVAAMDLVVTNSNVTAHMAGALNIPVWTFVPKGFGGIWHWFLERDDSPWYPSMRLLRQTQRHDWGPVMDQASSMLTDFVMRQLPADRK
jgi:tetratricopeptide (TPR) repeat protein